MAAASDSIADTSVDLHDASRLIEEAGDDPASPEASQDQPGPEASQGLPEPEASQGQPAPAPTPNEESLPSEAREAGEGGVPSFWDDADKPAWDKVPAELRPVLAKYEQQRIDFIAEKTRQATEERDEAMRVAQAANATVEQVADWWRKNGTAFHRAFVDRWSHIDWKALAESDPPHAARLMQQRQEEEALLAEATRRGEADIAAARATAEKQFEEARRVESGKLAAKLPEWFGTPQVAQRTWGDLRRYLFGKGIAADRINAIFEAPIVELALNSMRLEAASALVESRRRSASVANAVRVGRPAAAAAPVRVSPGPADPPGDRASDAARQVGERFRRSGGASIADAAELIRLSGL